MNNEDDFTFDISSNLNIGDITISDSSKDTITIDLGNNMTGTFDTTYTVDSSNMYTGTTDINTDWIYNKINIDPDKVENMCKEYPALEKVWRNFKSVYDMVLQDYEGKKKAGELDDDIPF